MITIIRDKRNTVDTNDKTTARFGKLYINGQYFCDTLENPDYLIPEGCYCVVVNKSPKFKRDLPLIYNYDTVKVNRGIRIHAGNTRNDTRGCILVGHHPVGKLYVENSYSREECLTLALKNNSGYLIIVEDYEI